jgi:hypothetical protein
MRIPALLAAALLLPLPLAQAAQADTTTPGSAQAPATPGSAQAPAAPAQSPAQAGRPAVLPSIVSQVPHKNVGPAVRSTAAAHRSAYAKDLSVQVSPPSFPTAPGAVGTVLVTVCNNGTDTPASATLVVNGPADPGLVLRTSSAGSDGGWNWIRFPVAQDLRPAACETHEIFASTISTTPGPRSYPGGTAVVTWDPAQNPDDDSASWSFDTSAPVTDAVLQLWRPPQPAAPGNPADFEVLERNLGPSTDYPWRGQVVAQLPPGSKWLDSAPDYNKCVISADGTTATCADIVNNTWANYNRGFALQVDPAAVPGTSIPVTLTYEAPANPDPKRFVLTVLVPVC